MPRLRFPGVDDLEPDDGAIPFPGLRRPQEAGERKDDLSTVRIMEALETMSRRMEVLARELGCLGFFDDDDRPRAA